MNRYGIGKHTLGPIGDHLTHFLESLKAVTGSRWWVQSLSNMVRSRCYVCNMPTHKKIHAINKSIKTYLNIIFYKRIQNDIHNISIYIHQNKDHIISIIPSSRIMYIYIFIFIFISLPWISSKHMVIVDIENYKYTQNNAYTCG